MEFETYEEIIDSYNSGVGVEEGESLTDYIKRNNIKIKEIQTDDLTGSRPMEKEGIMQMASGNMDIRIQEVVKEFIRKYNRKPNSFEEIKQFFLNEMGTAKRPTSMKMAKYNPGDYDPAMVDAYEQYKYDMEEQRPGAPIIDIDEFIRLEMGQARADVAAGGLPAILGV